MRGDIYLVAGEQDRIKIGISTNTKQRIKSLRHLFGSNVRLVARAPVIDMFLTERAFHEAYESRWVEREWFKMDAHAVLEAVSIMALFSQNRAGELPRWFSALCPTHLKKWEVISKIQWDLTATVSHLWINGGHFIDHDGLAKSEPDGTYFLSPQQSKTRVVKMNSAGSAFLNIHDHDCEWRLNTTAPYNPRPMEVFTDTKIWN